MAAIYKAALFSSCVILVVALQKKESLPLRDLINLDPAQAKGGSFLDAVKRTDCPELLDAAEQGSLEFIPSSSHWTKLFVDAQQRCLAKSNAKQSTMGLLGLEAVSSSQENVTVQLDRPIRFLHISKSSGTFFCDCAHHHGLNKGLRHDEYQNCHFLDEDKTQWGFHDLPPAFIIYNDTDIHQSTCQELVNVSKELRIDVEGNENYLPRYGLCSEFYNVMIFRDPMSRLLSHLVSINGRDREGELRLMNHTVDSITKYWPQIVDNFYTRNLAGYDVFKLPFGKVTQEHFEVAQSRLAQFDDIFIADSGLASEMNFRMGWDCMAHSTQFGLGRTNTVQSDKLAFVSELSSRWGSEQYERLKEINSFDERLYQKALLLNSVASKHLR